FLLPAIGRAALPQLIPPAFETVLANLGALGGLLLALPLVLAVALVWRTQARRSAPRFDPGRFLSLEWISAVVYWLINAVARVLRDLAGLIEGEGALLWALLLVIAAYVVSSGAIP
ncbi:MAG TPA: hypothetical protein VJ754_08025, partial [Anaerolineae bacterium]|nr:hypothetical protein [Anaerolineae bacterium]